jgi:hypothetical protein
MPNENGSPTEDVGEATTIYHNTISLQTDSSEYTPPAGQSGDGAEEMRRYFDAVFRDTTGWLQIAFGFEPHINKAGKYSHRRFDTIGAHWPDEVTDDLTSYLSSKSEEIDIWVCPYLMTHNQRTKGESVSRLTVHADIDREPFDSAKAETLTVMGGFAIASGSHGHAHAYLPLTRSVSVEQHQALCIGLGEHIGGADPGKHSDNDLLRPPGTHNLKATVFDHNRKAFL